MSKEKQVVVDELMEKFILEVKKKRNEDEALALATGHKPCSSEIIESRVYLVKRNHDISALAGLVSAILYK